MPLIYNFRVENPGDASKTKLELGELLTETEYISLVEKHGPDAFEAVKDGTVRSVTIDLTSKDVIHNFKVLPFRICQDAIPGFNIPIHFKPTKIGRYQVTCAQLCGDGHARMRGVVRVVSEKEWVEWQKSESNSNKTTQKIHLSSENESA